MAERAEANLENGLYDQALEGYRQHREERISATDRPEWENPHFYTLLMGDVELRRNRPANALQYYQEAQRHGVSAGLVADRYRLIAKWYMDHDDLEKAFELLNQYRSIDPLIFDSMLDRVAKQLTERETALPTQNSRGAPTS